MAELVLTQVARPLLRATTEVPRPRRKLFGARSPPKPRSPVNAEGARGHTCESVRHSHLGHPWKTSPFLEILRGSPAPLKVSPTSSQPVSLRSCIFNKQSSLCG